MKIRPKEFDYKMLCLLLIYMPFHYYICELFIKGTSIDNIVRDAVIILLFISSLRKKRGVRHGLIVGLGIVIMCFYATGSYILNSYPGTFNILRTYVIPILIFYVAAKIDLTENRVRTIHRIIYVELAIIGVYGFFQAFVLGDDFLILLGYSQSGGYLAGSSYYISGYFGYQRVVGTFISPNICGVIFAVGLAVLLFNHVLQEKKKKIVVFGLALGLLGSFSRSAILAFLTACVFTWLVNGKKKVFRPRTIMIALSAAVLGIFVIYFIDKYALDHLFSRMLQSSFSSLFSNEASAQKHIEDLYLPMENVLMHPFGMGFGNNGPMAVSYSNSAINVESSIYLMCYEIGLIGAIIYLVPYLLLVLDTIRNKKYQYFVPACASIICLVTYVLLPNIQTYEVIFYFYLMMGLYYNRSVREVFAGREIRRTVDG